MERPARAVDPRAPGNRSARHPAALRRRRSRIRLATSTGGVSAPSGRNATRTRTGMHAPPKEPDHFGDTGPFGSNLGPPGDRRQAETGTPSDRWSDSQPSAQEQSSERAREERQEGRGEAVTPTGCPTRSEPSKGDASGSIQARPAADREPSQEGRRSANGRPGANHSNPRPGTDCNMSEAGSGANRRGGQTTRTEGAERLAPRCRIWSAQALWREPDAAGDTRERGPEEGRKNQERKGGEPGPERRSEDHQDG
jgi:hypothetical protein